MLNPDSIKTEVPERYLEFRVGQDHYGLPLEDVREVIGVPTITPVPASSRGFRGIINLRDQVIPIYDLREKFGLNAAFQAETSIIICQRETGAYGVLVDSVDRVVPLSAERYSPDALSEKERAQAQYLRGVYRDEERMVLLIDLASVFTLELSK